MATAASQSADARISGERRALGVACGAHALHDGYTDLIYVLLPIWQAAFGLTYAEVGLLRGAFAGAMAAFQVPAGWLSERVGAAILLAGGTALTAIAFLLAGAATGFATLVALLLLGGLGSSVQHPIASTVVARAFAGARSRIALGNYNFAGDIGKMALPATTALLLTFMDWRAVLAIVAGGGLAAALAMFLLTPRAAREVGSPTMGAGTEPARVGRGARGGFPVLLSIGAIDSATRMAFLTFLPFMLVAKGASIALVGVALALVFAGGAVGKLICARLGVRFGVLPTVVLTEALTAVGIAALLPLPLWAGFFLLPIVGIALNGTSSVLYGTVPELVAPQRQGRAFGVFYTATIGSGAIAPAIYGLFSDAFGIPATMLLVAAVVLATIPLAFALRLALPPAAA
jgi:FSR family fosmidomycin resistance protein-like MFS transporter